MNKYIIELGEDAKAIQSISITSLGNIYVDSWYVESLEELNSDYINEHFGDLQDDAYNKGYAQCQDDYSDALKHAKDTAYQRGLNDAWECARKLFSSMAESDIEKAFPTEWNNGGFNALINLQPQEAIEKLKAYEEKQSDKIKRGDIVNVKGCCKDNLLGVVTKVWEDNCYIMCGDGSGGAWNKDSVVKTGKHIDIDKILEGLRYDS